MLNSDWYNLATALWGKQAAWIEGNGQYALLAWCRTLTVSLWQNIEEAERQKHQIDQTGCGGRCNGHHEIVDLAKPIENIAELMYQDNR